MNRKCVSFRQKITFIQKSFIFADFPFFVSCTCSRWWTIDFVYICIKKSKMWGRI